MSDVEVIEIVILFFLAQIKGTFTTKKKPKYREPAQ
jgi:hypothetical protein